MDARTRAALVEGVSDAVGFVLGALAGWGVARLLGFDFFASPGYDTRAMIGLVFIALGCGVGKWAAARWRAQHRGRG